MDNLSTHRTTDVLLFLLAYLIEPWWKILRSLALAGRRFES
jgi:hypothetical protein